MKQYRLNRLFNARSGRCFDVAVDHGFFNQPGFLQGIEDMRRVLAVLVDAAPDAIQLTLGQARHLQEIKGRNKQRNPLFPASGPATGSFNGLHAKSNFLVIKLSNNSSCDHLDSPQRAWI